MDQNKKKTLRAKSPYNAAITREQFLFHELRTTAQLKTQGLNDEEIIDLIVSQNLFQYPTEKSLASIGRTCIRRLEVLGDQSLVEAIANRSTELGKQIGLYAMMRQYHLLWDFFITVIGEKYRQSDQTFSRLDLNTYFFRLQEQDDWVATWSDSTVNKLKQIITKVLLENNYIDKSRPKKLNLVYLDPFLEEAIKRNGDQQALPAFNCFS